MNIEEVYEQCCMIRTFEKKTEKEFEKGVMRGTTHGCIGQELIPVLVMGCIDKEHDYITGTHRCHGQVLSYTGDPYRLACEMMGRSDGFNCGMGGSQHISVGNYITNGVTGGMAAVGAGMALSIKKARKEGLVVSFLGDGGFQEGYVQETLNMAQAYQIPILYVLENNRYAMSTPTASYTAGSMKDRILALGMAYGFADARDPESLSQAICSAFSHVRAEGEPYFLDVSTFRLCGHSKSDDRAYMTEAETEKDVADDPVAKLRAQLQEEHAQAIDNRISARIEDAFSRAKNAGETDFSKYQEDKKNGAISA